MSYRTKLLLSFFVLGLVAIGLTAWQATSGATEALRRSTYDHLTAVRETKRRLVENYFVDLTGHVLALSADESGIAALEAFRAAWDTLPALGEADPRSKALMGYYRDVFGPRVAAQLTVEQISRDWFPAEPKTRGLQHLLIAQNPHPIGSKDLLLETVEPSAYGAAHAKYHPTLQRYQGAFGFYDVFLIDARDGRVLYTVSKEIDLGQPLTAPPFANTALARAFQRAMAVTDGSTTVIEDFAPYAASFFAPAAFVAAPIWRAGAKIGVLAIQVSINRVNQLMTSDRNWANEGLGRTGHTYIVAADGTLRSDVRSEIEDSDGFLRDIERLGTSAGTIMQIRRHRTAILNLALPARVVSELQSPASETALGADLRDVEVIRSHARLNLPGLDWFLVAEMSAAEAFAPASDLLRRLLGIGAVVTVGFLAAAWLMARSVTRPVLALAEGTRALSSRDFNVRLPVTSGDEFGQLATSFNEMAERLEQTTVSRDDLDRANRELQRHQAELQALNARLMTAQEDERRRIARELHDDLSQRLAGAAIAIGTLSRAPQSSTAAATLRDVHAALAEISKDVHSLSRRLHPASLDDLGLVAALETECRSVFERSGVPVAFSAVGSFEAIDADVQLALYRICQEALRNVANHAAATDVHVKVEADDVEIRLEVADNGRGYDRQHAGWRAGLGLSSMAERARLVGGVVTMTSRVGEGTTVVATVPIERRA